MLNRSRTYLVLACALEGFKGVVGDSVNVGRHRILLSVSTFGQVMSALSSATQALARKRSNDYKMGVRRVITVPYRHHCGTCWPFDHCRCQGSRVKRLAPQDLKARSVMTYHLVRVDRNQNFTNIGVDDILHVSKAKFLEQSLLVQVLQLGCCSVSEDSR